MMSKGRAAIYRRVSGEYDERTASIEEQARRAIERAKSAGFECDPEVDIFEDHFSGFYLSEREGLGRLRQAIRDGRYQAVSVYAMDRLCRNMGHTAILFAEFSEHECDILSATEDIPNTPEGQLMAFIRAYLAQIERAKISERTRMGRQKRIASGLLPENGPPLYGYRYDNDRRVADPVTGPIVQEIYRLASEGWSVCRISGHLQSVGAPTPFAYIARRKGKAPRSGMKWSVTTVRKILRDPSYLGRTFIGRYALPKPEGKQSGPVVWDLLPVDAWIELPGDLTDRLVDDERWHQAQRMLDAKRGATSTRNEKDFWLLRGMVYCGRCGSAMYPHSASTTRANGEKQRYRYYACSLKTKTTSMGHRRENQCHARRTNAGWIEGLAWAKLKAILTDPEELERAIDRASRDGTADLLRADLARAEAALAQASSDQETMYEAYLSAVKERNERLAVRLKADWLQADGACDSLRATVAEYRGRLASKTDRAAVIAGLRRRIDRVRQGIEDNRLTDQQKRDGLLAFGARVELEGDSAHIRFEVATDPDDGPDGPGGFVVPSTTTNSRVRNYTRIEFDVRR